MLPADFVVKPTEYTYSEPIYIKKWSGGHIAVIVGYVNKHPERNCICLEKQWTGKGSQFFEQKFNIKDGADWLKIKDAIEKLWPELGISSKAQDIDRAITKISQETELLELLSIYPNLLSNIPEDVDILALPKDQKEALRKLLAVGGEIANSVINKLAEQPIKDLEQFQALLEEMKLSTINSLVTHVSSRIKFIDMFEQAIHNDSSYERRGPGSIHNLLKANIWLVDRNFSILHDDETLKNIILAQWDKKVQDPEKEHRPDFLCMIDPLSETNGHKKLVIIEIKRPTVKIHLDHIGQIMEYRRILQNHSGKTYEDFKCYIVGREVDQNLQMNPMSESGFVIKTYTDFIGEARRFYQEYLKIIEKENLAF